MIHVGIAGLKGKMATVAAETVAQAEGMSLMSYALAEEAS